MKIEKFDTDKAVFVIAEIGNNHEGSYSLAEEMIGQAAQAGASAVKFQTIIPDRLVSPSQPDRLQQLKKYCLSYAQFEKLAMVAKREEVVFLSTPFDIESVQFLTNLVPAFKIASGDNNFFPLLDAISETGKPVLLSTGMASFEDIRERKDFFEGKWRQRNQAAELALLHCVVSYPVPDHCANLGAIRELLRLGCSVGYSDHTIGIEAAVIAAALGARIVEKHFTIDKTRQTFRDHQLSADASDFSKMVGQIQHTLEMLGDGRKRILDIEIQGVKGARRSIVAARRMTAGTIIGWQDLNWLRPGTGLAPGSESQVLGRKLNRDLDFGEPILETDLTPCAA